MLRRDLRRARPQADRHRLLVLGILGLPCRPGILVHLGDRLDRRGAADQRVARRDGRGLGAVRGLHQDPDRRGRHRAGLRLRQVLGGHAAPGARAADRPVHGRAAVARLGVAWPACRPGSDWTPASGPPSRWPRSRWTRWRPAPAHRLGGAGEQRRRTAGAAVLRRSAAPPRHRPDHRRRVGDRAGLRRPGPRAAGAPGVDHRHRAPHRDPGAGRPRPDHLAVDGGVGAGRHRRRRRRRSTSPSSTRRSAISS